MIPEKDNEHHIENFRDFIKEIEKYFSIRLRPNEIKNINTFGELTDIVTSKINLRAPKDFNQNWAFNKLRDAISSLHDIKKEEIQKDTKLVTLFPRHSRKKDIRELEFELDFDLRVLRPYLIIEAFFILFLLGVIVGLFFNLIFGLGALGILILLINIAFKTGKEFNCETVGDLAEKITKDNNKKPKRNSATFTNEEIIEELKFVFGEFHPSSEEITRETKI